MAQKGRDAVVSDASWCTGPRTAAVRTLTNKQTKQTQQGVRICEVFMRPAGVDALAGFGA